MAVAEAFGVDVSELTALLHDHTLEEDQHIFARLWPWNQRHGAPGTVTGHSIGILFSGAAMIYVLLLGILLWYGNSAAQFRHFGQWTVALEDFWNYYRMVMAIAGLGLALYLGIVSGLFGVWQQRSYYGLAILVMGIIVTVGALELLPYIQHPNDQYSVAAVWVMYHLVPTVLCWVIVTIAGRIIPGWMRIWEDIHW